MSNLSLTEKLVLLAIKEDNGRVVSVNNFRYALAGAILLELAFNKRIFFEPGRWYNVPVKLTDTSPTGKEYLDEAIRLISSSKKKLRLRRLINKIGLKFRLFRRLVLSSLEFKGIVKPGWEKFLIAYYPIADMNAKRALKKELFEAIAYEQELDPQMVALLALIKAGRLVFFFVDKDQRKAARKKIATLLKWETFDPMIRNIAYIINSSGG